MCKQCRRSAGAEAVSEIRKSLHRCRGSNPRFGVCNKVMTRPPASGGMCGMQVQ